MLAGFTGLKPSAPPSEWTHPRAPRRRARRASIALMIITRAGMGQCEFLVGQSSGDRCVCIATGALRELSFRRIIVVARGCRAAGSARAPRARAWTAAQWRVGHHVL